MVLSGRETLVIVLTPPGRAAVASVLVAGATAAEMVNNLFRAAGRRSLLDRSMNRVLFGRWNGDDGEEVVVCRRSRDRVEVHCHGGLAAIRAIVASLVALGCVERDWQTWVRAAEPDPITAEAQIALAQATTERTARILLDQFTGALRRDIDALRAAIGRSEADAAAKVNHLLRRAELGLHLTTPWRIVIGGSPNVGKSTLVNRLLGYERAIVSDLPGTTRDALTATTAFDGWPVELTDTAGLRDASDPLEGSGIAISQKRLEQADRIVWVCDAREGITKAEQIILEQLKPHVIVFNKADLAPGRTAHDFTRSVGGPDARQPMTLYVSARTGEGISGLHESIVASIAPYPPTPGDAVPFTAEQQSSLVVVAQLRAANQLGEAHACLSNHPAWKLREC